MPPPTKFVMIFGLALIGALTSARGTFSEAPELQKLVAEGQLPPLNQRLPTTPLIITPVEKLGFYGGTWRMALEGYGNSGMLSRCLGYEQLVRWDPNWKRVVPNLASRWTVNADATVYRFFLRPGLRWSDGEPFTAHDITAWIEDVVLEPELTPITPGWLIAGDKLAKCQAIDDTTVEFSFAAPHALFLEHLACLRSNELTRYPAHYLQKIHRRHNPEGAAELVKRTGLTWPEAFRSIFTCWSWRNAELPTLHAWQLTNSYTEGVQAVLAKRNAYYWKVDMLGRQLPYFDDVIFRIAHTHEELDQLTLAGQVDYRQLHIASFKDLPAYRDFITLGRFQLLQVDTTIATPLAICFNLLHRDPAMRKMLGNRKVRAALSQAINRPRIITNIYHGTGKPWQVAPRPSSPFYNRRLGEQYTEYDPEQANAWLEEAGLHLHTDGLRYLPDGRPLHIKLLLQYPGDEEWPSILDLIKEDWRMVGVTLETETLISTEFNQIIEQRQHDASAWWGSGGHAAILDAEFFVPVSFGPSVRVPYAVSWARWFVNPQAEGAEKPPSEVEEQMELYRQVLIEPDRVTRERLMSQVLEMAANAFYVIGITMKPGQNAITTPGFRNFPASHFSSWLFPSPSALNPCQFFREKTEEP